MILSFPLACSFGFLVYQMGRNTKTAVTEKKCRYCISSIELNAVRCSHCTSWLDMNEYYNLEQLMAQARCGSRSDLQKEEYSRHGQVESPDRQHLWGPEKRNVYLFYRGSNKYKKNKKAGQTPFSMDQSIGIQAWSWSRLWFWVFYSWRITCHVYWTENRSFFFLPRAPSCLVPSKC